MFINMPVRTEVCINRNFDAGVFRRAIKDAQWFADELSVATMIP